MHSDLWLLVIASICGMLFAGGLFIIVYRATAVVWNYLVRTFGNGREG